MKINVFKMRKITVILGIVLIILACSLSSKPNVTPTATITSEERVTSTHTPTPTPIISVEEKSTPTLETNICQGLSGDIAMEVLIGPADAVGLEPIAVGSIPFSVVPEGGGYIVKGNDSISYQDVLEEEWGTYTVQFDLAAAVSGTCEGDAENGALDITMEMSGEQMVEVRSEGFQGDYPWAGSHTFEQNFPIEEGATSEGEGWTFVLHLK